MEKLTRILAVVDKFEDGLVVLEKSVPLARHFGAQVDLLLPDAAHAHELSKLCSEKGYDEVTLTSVHRGVEPLSEVILRRVLATHPDLVIKVLDDNDWQLANECPAPVLLVRHTPWADPVRFAAAVDVADEDGAETARSILHVAGFLALGCRGRIDVLYSEREQHDDAVRMERAVKLAQLVREFHVGCERIQVISGEPEQTLPPLAAARHYDVLVLGAQSHRPALQSIFGTMTSRMVEATDGDVVLVKAPGRGAGVSAQEASLREQRFHESEQLV